MIFNQLIKENLTEDTGEADEKSGRYSAKYFAGSMGYTQKASWEIICSSYMLRFSASIKQLKNSGDL